MGFFASIELMWYVFIIVGILLGVRALFGIVGWLMAFAAIGRAKKAVGDMRIGGEGNVRSGGFRWTLD